MTDAPLLLGRKITADRYGAIDPTSGRIGDNSFIFTGINHSWRREALEING